jgi:hypothetical protein
MSNDNFPTGQYLAELRESLPWESAKGDSVQKRINEEFGLKLTSIIPLRNLLNKHLAAEGAESHSPIKATPAKIRDARDKRGMGFALIAARAGITEGEARKLYAKANGALTAESGGRVYVNRAGEQKVVVPAAE